MCSKRYHLFWAFMMSFSKHRFLLFMNSKLNFFLYGQCIYVFDVVWLLSFLNYWGMIDTVLFQVYSTVIRQTDPYILRFAHYKCSYCLSPHSAIKLPLIMFPVLYCLSPWLSSWMLLSPTPLCGRCILMFLFLTTCHKIFLYRIFCKLYCFAFHIYL